VEGKYHEKDISVIMLFLIIRTLLLQSFILKKKAQEPDTKWFTEEEFWDDFEESTQKA